MKTCARCRQVKQDDMFYLRKRGRRAGELYHWCKDCYMKRGREYYFQNKDRQLPLTLARNRRCRLKLKSLLALIKEKPCAVCGKKYPHWILEFDHRKEEQKINNVSTLANRLNSNVKIILDEVKKCDVLCANCHRDRTAKRFWKKNIKEISDYIKSNREHLLRIIKGAKELGTKRI